MICLDKIRKTGDGQIMITYFKFYCEVFFPQEGLDYWQRIIFCLIINSNFYFKKSKEMSDVNTLIVDPLKAFVKDSIYLVKKCTKPDRKGIIT